MRGLFTRFVASGGFVRSDLSDHRVVDLFCEPSNLVIDLPNEELEVGRKLGRARRIAS